MKNAVEELEALGYTFAVEGDVLIYQRENPAPPDAATIRPLLARLRANKARALAFLRARSGGGTAPTVAPCWPDDPQYAAARTLDELLADAHKEG